MTKPVTIASSKMLIKVGDGADPEVFAAPCGINSKGFNRSAEANDFAVYDCDSPDDPAWVEREIATLSASVSGSGWMTLLAQEVWDTWYEDGVSKSVQIALLGTTTRTYQGKFKLTTLNLGGEEKGKVTCEIELQNDGPVTKLP